ncbi:MULTISPECIES: hypothetical protein [unclassified Streptomyces]|nr:MULTISPECIES: hypothetical protein [unclassified Streptomyces]
MQSTGENTATSKPSSSDGSFSARPAATSTCTGASVAAFST